MKIKTFYLNSTKEIIVKIVKEILVLFKVEINDADDTIFDYDELKIENIYDDVALNGVKTVKNYGLIQDKAFYMMMKV